MPYDNGCDPAALGCEPEYRDNIFPHDLSVSSVWDPNAGVEVITSVRGNARLSLGIGAVGAPAAGDWGIIGLALLLGLVGLLSLRKRRCDAV